MSFNNFRTLFLMIYFFLLSTVFPQTEAGARSTAVAGADISSAGNVFAHFINPAGTAFLGGREAGIFYSPAPFGLTELASSNVAWSEPFGFGTISAGFNTYGFELYRETGLSAGFAGILNQNLSYGFSIEYRNISIKNYGSDGTAMFNFGMIYKITGKINAGFSFNNFFRASVGNETGQLPVSYNLGISYSPDLNSGLFFAVKKELEQDFSIHAGIEYYIIKYLALRTGIRTEPDSYSGGIGINYSIFNINYSVLTHSDLGLTHQFAVIISFWNDN